MLATELNFESNEKLSYHKGVVPSRALGAAPRPSPVTRLAPGLLTLRNIRKDYRIDGRALPVLEDFSLTVKPGEFVTLVGPSGCGKSTILRLIVGLERDYAGDITLDGKPIAGPGRERSIMFQEHRLLPWLTVEQNIALSLEGTKISREERRATVASFISLVGLGGFERAFPQQLSGGMAQRVALARALAGQPNVLLLDEPLGALDSLTRAHLQRELLHIWRQQRVSMVMVTHDVEEAVFLSDKIVVLGGSPGRIKAVIPVDLPHPRNRVDPAFGALRQSVLSHLGE